MVTEPRVGSQQGRVALVTGANRGIGFEICRGLGALGMRVLLTARDAERGSEAAERIRAEGHDVMFRRLDVTEEASIAEVAAWLEKELGRLDALVNNAGVYLDEGVPGLEVDPQTVRRTMEVNVFGPLRLTQALVPWMRRRRYGRIVNLSSGYGQVTHGTGAGTLAYKMSKAALNMLTQVLAAELRGSGILVNAVDPGWVRTEMGGPSAPRSPEDAADTPVWLATLPDDGPTGGFFRDRKPIAW